MNNGTTDSESLPDKSALSEYRIEGALGRRWSPRAFSDRPVEHEKLLRLFEAARWAPSSGNDQPWNFVVATTEDPEAHDRLASCLNERNRRWAALAPVLMFSVARMRSTRNGNENRYALHDLGMSVGNLLAQATAMDLYVHQMAGFDREAVRYRLAIPEGYEPVAAMALGYVGNPGELPEDLRARELAVRERLPIGQFVFSGGWGLSLPPTGQALDQLGKG